ncbi:MAG: hypothetical protein ACRC9X_08800 [Bacteroidales bacterium]
MLRTYDSTKRDAYLSQCETWGEELVALGYNDDYEGIIVLPNVSDEIEFTDRTTFKTEYYKVKEVLIAVGEWVNKRAANQSAECCLETYDGNWYDLEVRVRSYIVED